MIVYLYHLFLVKLEGFLLLILNLISRRCKEKDSEFRVCLAHNHGFFMWDLQDVGLDQMLS